MAENGGELSQAQVDSVVQKLQGFIDKLPEEEQQIIGLMLQQGGQPADGTTEADTQGYAANLTFGVTATLIVPKPPKPGVSPSSMMLSYGFTAHW
jgi:hypothetical protein